MRGQDEDLPRRLAALDADDRRLRELPTEALQEEYRRRCRSEAPGSVAAVRRAEEALAERFGRLDDSGYDGQRPTLDEWLERTGRTATRYGGPGSAELHVDASSLSEGDRWDLYHLEDAVVGAVLSGGFVAVARRPRRRR